MANTRIVTGETIETFQRSAHLGVGQMGELIADARQRVFIDLGVFAAQGLQQVDLFLQTGFDPPFTALIVQITKGFVEASLQGVKVRVLGVAVAQSLNQVGEQPRDGRVQPTGAA